MNLLLKQEQKYKIILISVLLISLGIVAVFTFFTHKSIEKSALYVASQNAEKISSDIDAFIDSATRSIQLTSRLVEGTKPGSILRTPNEVVNSYLEQTPFDYIEYMNQKGIKTTIDGEEIDVNGRLYFEKGIAGESDVWIDLHPKNTDKYLMNFYTPLYYHEKISGVLMGVISVDACMLPYLETDFFEEKVVGVLCNEYGEVISSTLGVHGETYLADVFRELQITDAGQAELYDHLNREDYSAFPVKSKEGKAIVSVYVSERTGWQIVQIVPAKSFKAVMAQNTRGAYAITGLISFFLLSFLLYVRIDAKKKEKELQKEKEIAVQSYEQLLITTAADTYKGIRRINLDTAQSTYIYIEDKKVLQVEMGNWAAWLERLDKYLHPEDLERVRAFLSLDNLKKMDEGTTYQENYRSFSKNAQGYYNTYTTMASITHLDGKRTAVMTTIDTTAAVIHEREQKRLLASAASIYVSMHAFDFKNDVLEEVNSAEHISKIVNGRKNGVQEVLRDAMRRLTDEQYMDAMMEFIDFKTLNKRMKGVKTITLEFLGKASGWCRARFIVVDYDEDGNLSHALWVVENIDVEKQKANRLLYLSETDLMTGIRNRGSGEARIKELIDAGLEGIFCLLDVDKFKSINDNFGHGVGDKVLIAIAGCLKESFRDSDIVMRLGGDEFAVFANGVVDRAVAENLIKRFFEKVSQIEIPELGERKIYISLGAAMKRNFDNLSFEELYRNADSCTYKSKKIEGSASTFYGE